MSSLGIDLGSVLALANPANKQTGSSQAKAATATGNAASSSSNGGLTSTTTGTTFLNLLVKELQNQDPTAPMDSTAMVGQMISLNQLDQLISINQALSSATTSAASTTPTATPTPAPGAVTPAVSSANQMAQRAELLNNVQNTNAAQAAMQSAADPNKTLDLSTLNLHNGGK